MSVINRMLQELESRHEQPQAKLPGMVRAVAPPRRDYRRWLVLGALLVAALLGVAGMWTWQRMENPPPVLVTPAPSVAVAPEVAPVEPAPPEAQTAQVETLVTEYALASPPAYEPKPRPVREAAPLLKAVPEVAVQAAPVQQVVKAVPGTAAETSTIKQVSPAQRADQTYRQGLALHNQGRASEAQAAFEDALKVDPRHLGARQALLALLVEGKHFAQAERLLQDGLDMNLAPPALAMALARLQLEQGNQHAALATLDKYSPQAQGSADYHAFQAALLQRAGRHAEALIHYQAALNVQPDRAVWWMGLGISLQAEKKSSEAEQAYNRARAMPGLSPELRAFVEQRLKQLQ